MGVVWEILNEDVVKKCALSALLGFETLIISIVHKRVCSTKTQQKRVQKA